MRSRGATSEARHGPVRANWKVAAAASICALIFAGCAQREPSPGAADPPESSTAQPTGDAQVLPGLPQAVPGEYLVKFRGSDPARARNALGAASVQMLKAFRTTPSLYLVRVAQGADGTRLASDLAQRDDVEYVEPNFYVHERAVPNDPRFSSQWGLLSPAWFGGEPGADMNATAAWDITTGSTNVVIAVIDSGVDYVHEDLAANMYSSLLDCNADGADTDVNGYVDDCHGIDVVDEDSDPMDPRGHGTHVAGILGAVGNNGIGVAGVAWQVRILPCRFLDSSGRGTTAGAIECLDYVASLRQAGVNIVATNNSWGQPFPSQALDEAIRRQQQAGILFVAAAGNELDDVDQVPDYPCRSEGLNVICVAGSGLNGHNAFNWGKHAVLVHAPATSIWSTYPGNEYTALGGTSMATPHVTGVIALLAAQDPTRDWSELRNLIAAGADPYAGPNPQYNGPHLNAGNSLACSSRIAFKRLKPFAVEVVRRPVGARIVLSVLHVDCASPAGLVVVNVQPSGTAFFLTDDGTNEDEVAGDGIYTGAWTVPAVGDHTLSVQGIEGDLIRVKGMAGLKPGFPAQLHISADRSNWIGGQGHAITVGNFTGDAHPEILMTGLLDGPLHGFDHTGAILPGWPSYEWVMATAPAMGELDGNPSFQEVVAEFHFGRLRRLSEFGITLPNWPQSGAMWGPALADLNGDGTDEIISGVTYNADGTPFPSAQGIPSSQLVIPNGPPAVIDLDGDGLPDVVSADPMKIWAVNAGGVLPGFPVSRVPGYGGLPMVVAGDIDGEGKPEVILVQPESLDGGTPNAIVYIYSHRGVLKHRFSAGQARFLHEQILADLDADGVPELIVSTGNAVAAYRGDGTPLPGWPFVLPESETSLIPRIGDITGDGRPEVVFQAFDEEALVYEPPMSSIRRSPLYAIDVGGSVLPGFPKDMNSALESSAEPAIADLDLDGRNEYLNISPSGFGYREALFAWDFSDGPTGPIEWGQYRGGADHKGSYELGKNLPDRAFLVTHAQGRGSIAGTGINCGSDCIENLPKGSVVQLTATPAPGAVFEGWSGACSGVATTCSVAVSRLTTATARFSATVTVQFAGTGAGTVFSDPIGLNCTADCSQTFPGGSGVRLNAMAAAGSDFDGWSGACTGFGLECHVAADGAMLVTANFTAGRRLTVEMVGGGTGIVTSTPAGISCRTTCSSLYPLGSQVLLKATADPGFYVLGWDGNCVFHFATPDQCTVTMEAARSIKVRVVPLKKITVQVAGDGGGTIASVPSGISCVAQTCTILARSGDDIELTAWPRPDSEFTGWAGERCSGYALTCSFIAAGDTAVTANFTLRTSLETLQVGTAGDAAIGKVTSSIGGIDCRVAFGVCSAYLQRGSNVTLTAVWGANGTFSGWSGDCAGDSPTCTLTMDRARNATARFTSLTPSRQLDVAIAGDSAMGKVTAHYEGIDCGQGATRCSTSVPDGTLVFLTAAPDAGGSFAGWTGGCTGYVPTCMVKMDEAKSVTARFVAGQFIRPQMLHVIIETGDVSWGKVTASAGGIDCGQGSIVCSAEIEGGAAVTLTATAAAGRIFQQWSGPCSGNAPTCTVRMDATRTVSATFATPPPGRHVLNVSISGNGTGRVISPSREIACGQGGQTCSASMVENSTVVLTAEPAADSTLGGWSGACSGTSATCSVSMSAARNVTVVFNLRNAPPSGGGGGGGSGGGGGGGGGLELLQLLGLLLLLLAASGERARMRRAGKGSGYS